MNGLHPCALPQRAPFAAVRRVSPLCTVFCPDCECMRGATGKADVAPTCGQRGKTQVRNPEKPRRGGKNPPVREEPASRLSGLRQRRCPPSAQFLGRSPNPLYEENGKAVPGYRDLIDKLSGEFPLGQPIIGEQKQKDFIKLYGNILRLKNILSAFDQFAGHELLPERDFQDYQSVYLDLYQAYRPKTDGDKENINDDITFEIELIRQVEINIDYILMLVMKYHESNCKDKSILGTIDRAIDSSIQLRSKKDLIRYAGRGVIFV